MTKPDDSSLDPDERRAVETKAHALLDRASAWNRFPTPIDDILAAANLKVAPKSVFDPVEIMRYLAGKTMGAMTHLKSAVSKVFGIYDAEDETIHIDHTVSASKQAFLKLHEAGHHEMPAHRRLYKFFQDCAKTLSPEIADQFEREANNFARHVLFQGDTYGQMASDCDLCIRTPMKLAPKFGASIYASAREFARTNHRACLVYILEPIVLCEGVGARADVRRIEGSPAFAAKFGIPSDTVITLEHHLGHLLPIGRKMTSPRPLVLLDRNGERHECLAEAFDTKFNVIILLYPVKALAAAVILPGSGAPDTRALPLRNF